MRKPAPPCPPPPTTLALCSHRCRKRSILKFFGRERSHFQKLLKCCRRAPFLEFWSKNKETFLPFGKRITRLLPRSMNYTIALKRKTEIYCDVNLGLRATEY